MHFYKLIIPLNVWLVWYFHLHIEFLTYLGISWPYFDTAVYNISIAEESLKEAPKQMPPMTQSGALTSIRYIHRGKFYSSV